MKNPSIILVLEETALCTAHDSGEEDVYDRWGYRIKRGTSRFFNTVGDKWEYIFMWF